MDYYSFFHCCLLLDDSEVGVLNFLDVKIMHLMRKEKHACILKVANHPNLYKRKENTPLNHTLGDSMKWELICLMDAVQMGLNSLC